MCIRCAGIHRNLGVHLSKVKSVNLDSWTAEQVSVSKNHQPSSWYSLKIIVYLYNSLIPFFSYLGLRLCFLLQMMMEIGNSRGRAVYEANIPDGFRRPQTDSYAFLHNKCYSLKMLCVICGCSISTWPHNRKVIARSTK